MKKLLSLLLSIATIFSMFAIIPTANAAEVPYGGPDYATYPNEFSDYWMQAGWDYNMTYQKPENVWNNPWDRPVVVQTLLSDDGGKTWSDNLDIEPGQKFMVKIRLAKNKINYASLEALEFTPMFRRSQFTVDKNSCKIYNMGTILDSSNSFVTFQNKQYPENIPYFVILLETGYDTTLGETFDFVSYELTANKSIAKGQYTITTDLPVSVAYWDENKNDLNDIDKGSNRLIYGITCATVTVGGGSSNGSSGGLDSSSTQTTGQSTNAKKTGWQKVNGAWYYYNANGNAVKGWVKDGGAWYYLKSNGAMATGWVKDGNTWYYMNSSGAMATGWIKDGNAWYFLNSNGAMATGWKLDGGKWYYMNSSGAMLANQWVLSSGKWYYLTGSGAMAVNTTINGYVIDANGVWVK